MPTSPADPGRPGSCSMRSEPAPGLMNILIVDDDPIIVSLMKSFAGRIEGCEPVCFTVSSEALEWCVENEPGLVIVDYMMPPPDGIEFISRFRGMPERKDIPIIMVTAANEREVCYHALELGANDFLTKPVDSIELRARIRNMLALSRSRKELAFNNLLLEQRVAEETEKGREKDRLMIQQAHLAALGRLAKGITHEINTPLTYVKGNLELLKAEFEASGPKAGGEAEDLFEAISDGIMRMESIVGSMRQISGFSNKEKVEGNVYSTVIYALRMAHHRAKHITNLYINGRPFDIRADKNEELFQALIDPQGLEQVWIILMNNALDALERSSLPFETRHIRAEISGFHDKVQVLFMDNGGGIAEDMMSGVFDLFKSKKSASGMGIGLNIAKTIVDDHGGTIRAYNDGGGSVFEIMLPVTERRDDVR